MRRAIACASKGGFRIIHFSVQADHIHAIVEAGGRLTLSRGARHRRMLRRLLVRWLVDTAAAG